MAYNSDKGKQHSGDVLYEQDPTDTQIDFENDSITLRTGNKARLEINNSHVSASGPVSGSKFFGDFVGNGSRITSIPAGSVAAAGSTTQVQYNNSDAFAGSANMVFDGTTLTVAGLSSTGNSTLGDASGDSLTINAETVNIPNVAAGTDNTVVIYNGSTLLTDEIGPKVWAGKLVDYTGTPVAAQITTWSGGDTVAGSTTLTYISNSRLAVSGAISASMAISGTKFHGDGSALTNLPSAAIGSYLNPVHRTVILGGPNSVTVSGSNGLTYNNGTVLAVSGTISASMAISGTKFHGDGSALTNLPSAAVTSYSNAANGRIITSVNSTTINGEGNLTFDGTKLAAGGHISASLGVSGSSLHTTDTTVDSLHVSSSLNISGSKFYGDGSKLTGIVFSPPGSNTELFYNDGGAFGTNANLKFVGNTALRITGSLTVTGSAYGTSTIIDATHVSSSLNISGSRFYGDGSKLTGLPSAAITTYLNPIHKAVILGGTGVNSVSGSRGLTYNNRTVLAVSGNVSASQHVSGAVLYGENINIGGPNMANSSLYVKSPADNSVVAIFKSPSNDTILAMSGSGAVVVGGKGAPYVAGKFNISGSDNEKLISLKSDTRNPVFYVEGDGDLYNSGSITLKETEPYIQFSSSVNAAAHAKIGLNSSNNILIQNNTSNKHIVFKASRAGSIKEGLRLDGAVPEVVVNQDADSLINFRVESNNNPYMLYVSGAGDCIGVNQPVPKTALDIRHNPTALANDTGGGEVITFGGGTTVKGKTYYLHSNGDWDEVGISTAASGGLGMLGIALGVNPATDGMLIRGFFDAHTYLSGTFTVGTTLYLTSSGGITTTTGSMLAGDSLRVVGTCTTTSKVIYFNPSPDYLVLS